MFYYLRHLPKLAALSGLVALGAACSTDIPSAPLAPLAPTTALAAKGGAPSKDPWTSFYVGDTLVVDFTILPGETTIIVIGDHKLRIPAKSICDPAKSTYGPTEWDKACTLLTSPLSMRVKSWSNALGHPHMDFSRDLRFVPGRGNELPIIWFKDRSASMSAVARILYCATPKSACIDESLADPSLATQTDAANGFVYRIIKHFSGYNVWA